MTDRRRLVFALLAIVTLSRPGTAQPADGVRSAILGLSHCGVLMDLSAHPDDEDGATLAYYGMKFGVKTYSVFFTRGEGGQNATGPELYEELGALRTGETEAAAGILGTDVRFLNFKDFGYSKTATETLQKWGGATEVLRRLVYTIRALKPDVIFTNHNTIDGHGNHQVVAIAAIAAFDAAADSTTFPEQLRMPGLGLWQPRKLYFRVRGRDQSGADVTHDIASVDSARGVSYMDIASQALRMHKTQGLEGVDLRAFTHGKTMYKLMRANSMYEPDSTDFFSGIDLWKDTSIASLLDLRAELARARSGMPRDSVLAIFSGALGTIDSIEGRSPGPLRARILARWENCIERITRNVCGLDAQLTLDDATVVPGQEVGCTLTVSSPHCSLSVLRCGFALPPGWVMNESTGAAPEIDPHHLERKFVLMVGGDAQATLPRALEQYKPMGFRQEVAAHVVVLLNGLRLRLGARARFDVTPPVDLAVTPGVTRIDPERAQKGKVFTCRVTNHFPHKAAGRIIVSGPPGWTGETSSFAIASEDSSATAIVRVHLPKDVAPGSYLLTFKTSYAATEVKVNVFHAAVAPGIAVGVVKSYDTTLEDVLQELGVRYSLLGDNDLSAGDLSKYSSIVVDIRAYLVRDALRQSNQRLLDYVHHGGNLAVMYQRQQEWKPAYAPYPFQLTGRRVTVEDAPVNVLQPEHPLFNCPNRISQEDWQGWVQERAVYVPGDVARQYSQLLACNDPDEEPLTTAYLVAAYGEGSYIYTSYVWYREMKEMNPGAFRCFANMLSYPVCRK